MISAIIVARILSPAEIGLFAVSYAVMLMMNGFRGLGVGAYMIQIDVLDKTVTRTAFTLVSIMGLILYVLTNFGASYLSNWYETPQMGDMLKILAVNFLIFPFTIMVQSKAARAHDFGWMAFAELVAACISSAVSVYLAYIGYGAMALAYGTIAFSFVSTLTCGVRHFAIKDYGLGLIRARALLAFGGWVTGSNVVYQLNTAMVDLIVGKFQGFSIAGMYDRAATVTRLVWEQIYPAIGQVLFSSFAQEKRDGRDLKQAYFYRLRCVLDLLWPLLIWLAIFGDYAVQILFGDQWVQAGSIARILAVSIIFAAPFSIAKELGVALGKTKAFFLLDLFVFMTRLAAVFVAARHDIESVAIALIVPAVLYMIFSQWILSRIIDFQFHDFLKTIGRPLCLVVLLVFGLLASRFFIEKLDVDLVWAFLGAGAAGGIYILILLFITRSPLKHLVLQKLIHFKQP
ncbi:oligosaccharide flippase family protein [Kordiimonas sp. SCSIO 12610]|nr:oligosaccharide flippase family protein [Kordiimonas sp. SCSIO 12610]